MTVGWTLLCGLLRPRVNSVFAGTDSSAASTGGRSPRHNRTKPCAVPPHRSNAALFSYNFHNWHSCLRQATVGNATLSWKSGALISCSVQRRHFPVKRLWFRSGVISNLFALKCGSAFSAVLCGGHTAYRIMKVGCKLLFCHFVFRTDALLRARSI